MLKIISEIKKYIESNDYEFALRLLNILKSKKKMYDINIMLNHRVSKKFIEEWNNNEEEIIDLNAIIVSNLLKDKYKIEDENDLYIDDDKLINDYYSLLNDSYIINNKKKIYLKDLNKINDIRNRLITKYNIYDSNYKYFSKLFIKMIKKRKINNGTTYNYYQDISYNNKILIRNKIKEDVRKVFNEFINKYKKDNTYNSFWNNQLDIKSEEFNINRFKGVLKSINNDYYELFNKMISNKTITFNNRLKMSYSTYILDKKIPYIVFCSNNSIDDNIYLSHEFGHCIQYEYVNKKYPIEELIFPSLSVQEIYSQYFEKIFVNQFNDKNLSVLYIELFLERLLMNCLLDEFEDYIYSFRSITIKDIESKWKELYKVYFSFYYIEDNEFLSLGKGWLLDYNLFISPYYSTNYYISDIISLAMYLNNEDNIYDKVLSYDINEYINNYEIINIDFYKLIKEFIKKWRL